MSEILIVAGIAWLVMGVFSLIVYLITWTDKPPLWFWPVIILLWPIVWTGGTIGDFRRARALLSPDNPATDPIISSTDTRKGEGDEQSQTIGTRPQAPEAEGRSTLVGRAPTEKAQVAPDNGAGSPEHVVTPAMVEAGARAEARYHGHSESAWYAYEHDVKRILQAALLPGGEKAPPQQTIASPGMEKAADKITNAIVYLIERSHEPDFDVRANAGRLHSAICALATEMEKADG